MNQLVDYDKIRFETHLAILRKLKWKVIDWMGKDYIIPSSYDIDKKLTVRNIMPEDEVMAYDEEFYLDPSMKLRYCSRMRYSDVPREYIIMPGNPDEIEQRREDFFKGVIE